MNQQQKKDYLQRLIEEFFAKLYKLTENKKISRDEQQILLGDCFTFFAENFTVYPSVGVDDVVKRVDSVELLDQYASLLVKKYEIDDAKDAELLNKALSLVEYLQNEDNTYSWDRVVLREDILRLLSTNE